MAVRVLMPKGSDTMTEGKVLKWLKQEGDKVSSGDAVVEIETDKVDMEVETTGVGVLRKILVQVGQVVPVGQLLGVIGKPDEDIEALIKSGAVAPAPAAHQADEPKASPASPPPTPTKPVAPPPAAPQPVAVSAPSAPAPQAQGHAETSKAAPAHSTTAKETDRAPWTSPQAGGGRVLASPLARRIAKDKGLDLSEISGSGPGGRIIRQDVDRAMVAIPSAFPSGDGGHSAAPARPAYVPGGPEFQDEPLSSMRKIIATRLTQSLGPVPHFYLTIEVDMRRAMELRQSANNLNPELKLTYNDIILKACAAALRARPDANASFNGESIRTHNRVHIGIAVPVDGGGLITPVIQDCDQKSLEQVSREAKDLVARARSRKLAPNEYTGATFSVSNLGMMGIDQFSAIINPPEGAILAVGAVVEKPVVAEHRIEIGHRCRMTLSCDHRVIDGAIGAKFLQTLQSILENPVYLAF
ncbi:MAG TPA: dihydrolipoamide acetyltransferase family protein [Terriglobia bacterium]|nr:dihydrolipoamide acetyltransferase family protein [Terriglobia bacterium]